eukprot:TRINITY_DN6743_c0_g1_i1.p1 TRINITY_DN6743_c0_g1~~TRINITY_DN6743_c0_g1_i1.p1  ORF type:complete len:478 (-),score=75.27 TRINITY_DN6743_c0_g1_i1:117-1550(-)
MHSNMHSYKGVTMFGQPAGGHAQAATAQQAPYSGRFQQQQTPVPPYQPQTRFQRQQTPVTSYQPPQARSVLRLQSPLNRAEEICKLVLHAHDKVDVIKIFESDVLKFRRIQAEEGRYQAMLDECRCILRSKLQAPSSSTSESSSVSVQEAPYYLMGWLLQQTDDDVPIKKLECLEDDLFGNEESALKKEIQEGKGPATLIGFLGSHFKMIRSTAKSRNARLDRKVCMAFHRLLTVDTRLDSLEQRQDTAEEEIKSLKRKVENLSARQEYLENSAPAKRLSTSTAMPASPHDTSLASVSSPEASMSSPNRRANVQHAAQALYQGIPGRPSDQVNREFVRKAIEWHEVALRRPFAVSSLKPQEDGRFLEKTFNEHIMQELWDLHRQNAYVQEMTFNKLTYHNVTAQVLLNEVQRFWGLFLEQHCAETVGSDQHIDMDELESAIVGYLRLSMDLIYDFLSNWHKQQAADPDSSQRHTYQV